MMMMMMTIICSNNWKSQEVKQYRVMWQTMQLKGYTCYTEHLFLFAMPFFGGCHCIHRKEQPCCVNCAILANKETVATNMLQKLIPNKTKSGSIKIKTPKPPTITVKQKLMILAVLFFFESPTISPLVVSQGHDRKASSTPGTTTWLFAKMFAKWHYICEDDSEDMCLF